MKPTNDNIQRIKTAFMYLPEDWEQCKTSEGKFYFCNIVNGTSEWVHPTLREYLL